MFIGQHVPFVHQAHPRNNTITESHCPQCRVLVAARKDKFLAIAEAVHKCRTISAPRLRQEDLRRLH
jgi:hypothetical protein